MATFTNTGAAFSAGRDDFTEEEVSLLASLVKRHYILVEETHGIQHCYDLAQS